MITDKLKQYLESASVVDLVAVRAEAYTVGDPEVSDAINAELKRRLTPPLTPVEPRTE